MNNKNRSSDGKGFGMPNLNTSKNLSPSNRRDMRNDTVYPNNDANDKNSTWTCARCQRSNRSNHSRCIRCDSPRDSTNHLDDIVQIVDLEWKCPICTLMNTATCCEACGYNPSSNVRNATTLTPQGNPKIV